MWIRAPLVPAAEGKLFITNGRDYFHTAGPQGGIKAGPHPHHYGKEESQAQAQEEQDFRRTAVDQVPQNLRHYAPQQAPQQGGAHTETESFGQELGQDVPVLGPHGLLQADLPGAGHHRGHHHVPDAHSAQDEGGAGGEINEKLDPPGQLQDPFQPLPGNLHLELFRGLIGLDDARDGGCHPGNVIPGLAAEIEAVGERRADQAIQAGGEGNEGGVGGAGVGYASQDSGNPIDFVIDLQQPAPDIHTAEDALGQFGSQDTFPLASGHGSGPEEIPRLGPKTAHVPVDVIHRQQGKAVLLAAVVGGPSLDRGETQLLDAFKMFQGGQGSVMEPLGLVRAGIVKGKADDRDPANQVQVLVEVLLHLPAHGEDVDETGNPQGDGQNYPQVTPPMADHLAHADG